MNWIDTGLIIAICTCASGLTQFLFWKHIAKTKSYESEIGKLNAQIEKIAQEKFGDLAGLAQQYLFYWRRGA